MLFSFEYSCDLIIIALRAWCNQNQMQKTAVSKWKQINNSKLDVARSSIMAKYSIEREEEAEKRRYAMEWSEKSKNKTSSAVRLKLIEKER